jgi:hypothetical protein
VKVPPAKSGQNRQGNQDEQDFSQEVSWVAAGIRTTMEKISEVSGRHAAL